VHHRGSHGTLSRSDLEDHARVSATTAKIGTGGCSTCPHGRRLLRYPHAPLPDPNGLAVGAARLRPQAGAPSIFGAGPFGRRGVTHAFADSDCHGHRPAVCMGRRPLWGLVGLAFGASAELSVHPASPVLLTRNGPLTPCVLCSPKRPLSTRLWVWHRARSEFDGGSRAFRPRGPPSFSLPDATAWLRG
jgi:hypothetical protein